jgi:small GTP-binding protein
MAVYKFKVPIAGDGAVGKTSLIIKFIENKFSHEYKSTIGVDIFTKSINLGKDEILLTLWDIAGQERFKIIRKGFFEGAKGAIIVYDVTKKESFKNVSEWAGEITQFSGDIPMFICGNKIDLSDKREVSTEEGKKLSLKMKKSFIETSAKLGENVEEAFTKISSMILGNK